MVNPVSTFGWDWDLGFDIPSLLFFGEPEFPLSDEL